MEIPLLNDIVIIFGLSIAVLFIFHLCEVAYSGLQYYPIS